MDIGHIFCCRTSSISGEWRHACPISLFFSFGILETTLLAVVALYWKLLVGGACSTDLWPGRGTDFLVTFHDFHVMSWLDWLVNRDSLQWLIRNSNPLYNDNHPVMLFRRFSSIENSYFASPKGLDIFHQKLGCPRNAGLINTCFVIELHERWILAISPVRWCQVLSVCFFFSMVGCNTGWYCGSVSQELPWITDKHSK